MIICKVCNKEFEEEAGLHKHIKAHDLFVAEYYQKHFPRFDKLDGSLIRFRNKEQYFSTDFNSRDNLRFWIIKNEDSIVRPYIKLQLEKRIQKKNLVWTPTQVELRTSMLPPIQTYNAYFGSYYKLCEELGLKNRFQDDIKLEKIDIDSYEILIDSREQLPLSFSRPSTVKGLKFGDYACSQNVTCDCYFERKSIQDFVGTLSGGKDRFDRELDRAKEAGAYIIILVEELLSKALSFNTLDSVYKKNVRITPEFVFHNVRDILQSYPNVQFLFVKDRNIASKTIERIFESNCSYKNLDLQLAYDLNQF